MSGPLKQPSARGALTVGTVALALLVGGFGTWSALARLSGAIIAPGRVEVEQNRQAIQHLDGGTVAELRVREGDTVAEDEVLVRLDPSVLTSELAIVEGLLFELLARRGRLEAERDGRDAIAFDADLVTAAATRPEAAAQMDGQARLLAARLDTIGQETEQLARRREQIETQIEGIRAQRASLDTQIELIGIELADQQTLLDRGLAQAGRVLSLRREAARLEGQRGELVAAEGEAGSRITEIEIEILRIGTRVREAAEAELRDLETRIFELVERRRSLTERLGRLEIRAPLAGTIYGLQVFGSGAVVRPAEPAMFLVPEGRPLVIAARVPAVSIDEVSVGQETVLKFPAFDQRTMPDVIGTVSRLSADAFIDEMTAQAYYRAEIVLAEGEQGKIEGMTLLPGMPVEAFISTEARSPFAYLVRPLMVYFDRAFRES
jgi:HlyD family type I secretion membrane fusion protein